MGTGSLTARACRHTPPADVVAGHTAPGKGARARKPELQSLTVQPAPLPFGYLSAFTLPSMCACLCLGLWGVVTPVLGEL